MRNINEILIIEKEKLIIENRKFKSLNYKMNMERKILLDKVHILKGNVRVFCRARPRTF